MGFQSKFLNESQERGFIHQGTDLETLDKELQTNIITAYIGFDATAKSLHVGNLLPIMWLRLLQRCGHKPIVLIGGGTTRIGDPSGKDESRQLLNEEGIQKNIDGITTVFKRYLKFGDGPTDAILVNNADWLLNLNYIDFLRDYGRHFSVNRMLTFDSVKLRLDREQPLSFLEFNYMIFQAYDFLELRRKYNCLLQMGGSDQWGNIINGVELTRRVLGKSAFGLTAPLITTASGAKMGKTANGAVWLNEEMLPSYDFWQYWRNTDDADVDRFLRCFTDLPLDEIKRLESLKGAELNEAKKILADRATALARGSDALPSIHQTIQELFESKTTDLSKLEAFEINNADLSLCIDEIFVKFGLCTSKGEAKRLIQGKGAKLNDKIIDDIKYTLSIDDFNQDKLLKLSSGKKKHIVLHLMD